MGVSPGSVLSKAVRQVVLDKVKTLVKNSTDIASEVGLYSGILLCSLVHSCVVWFTPV